MTAIAAAAAARGGSAGIVVPVAHEAISTDRVLVLDWRRRRAARGAGHPAAGPGRRHR